MELNNRIFTNLSNCSIKKLNKKYKFLGEGIARKVFELNNKLVIKVAKNEDGYHQNFVERYIYANCTPELKRYLCPIIYSDDRIIVMLKALPYHKLSGKHSFIDPRTFRNEQTVISDLKKLINEYHLFTEDIFAARSWGAIDNNFYLIDFGCTSDFGDSYYDGIKSLYYLNKQPYYL